MQISWLYFATVFWTGAAVLIVEISAIRLLSIQFGASLNVLSGVLTVILLSLSCGYYLGGKLADRKPYLHVLYTAITVGGISLLALSSIALAITHPAYNITANTSPLLLAFLLFFLPAFILGIDSPFVTKLLTINNPEKEGSLVGLVFFWSTLGSIIGSLSTGFLLLPYVGIEATFLWTSISLVVLGVIGLTVSSIHQKQLPHTRIFWLLGVSFIIGILLYGTYLKVNQDIIQVENIIYRSDGLYSHLIIYDQETENGTLRLLRREANSSSAIYVDSSEIVFEYTKYVPHQITLLDDPQSMLLVGGGAYTIPKLVTERFSDISIDVAELEPSLFSLAHTYFQLPDSDMIHNHVVDGRLFMQENTTKYDIIYLDAFNSGHYIPPHLITKEFFTLVRDRLSEDGIVLVNFIGDTDTNTEATLTGSFVRTFLSVFPNSVAYQTLPPGDTRRQNILFQASKNPQTNLTLTQNTTITLGSEDYSFSSLYLEPASLIHTSDMIFSDNKSRAELFIAQGKW